MPTRRCALCSLDPELTAALKSAEGRRREWWGWPPGPRFWGGSARSSMNSWLAVSPISDRCLPVADRAGKMHQLKPVVHLVERFGVSKKQISAGQQVGIKLLHYFALRTEVEVDQNIAAEDQVDAFEEGHFAVVVKIDPIEPDQRFDLIGDLQALFVVGLKVFLS